MDNYEVFDENVSLNKVNILKNDKDKFAKLARLDKWSFVLGKFLTSTLLIIVVLVTFLLGVAVHLKEVFDSWFLAVGLQSVVLISSANSDILPTIKITKDKTLTLIPLILSALMCWYLFINFNGLDYERYSIDWWTAVTKAFGIATTEYLFSYLFTYCYNKFIKDFVELDNIEAKKVEEAKKAEESKPTQIEKIL